MNHGFGKNTTQCTDQFGVCGVESKKVSKLMFRKWISSFNINGYISLQRLEMVAKIT